MMVVLIYVFNINNATFQIIYQCGLQEVKNNSQSKILLKYKIS